MALIDIEGWLKSGGLVLLGLMVFAESGMLIGFFLPGDSLLFIAGFLASDAGGRVLPSVPWVIITVVAAAIIGDQVGYAIGTKLGPRLFTRTDSKLLKPEYIEKTQAFMDRHGPKTIVLARFVPIVRAFVAVVAGAGRMKYRTYVTYNIVGGVLWGLGVTILGYFLGSHKVVKDNIEITLILVVILSLLPVVFEVLRHRRNTRRA